MIRNLSAKTRRQNVLSQNVSGHSPAETEIGVIVCKTFFGNSVGNKQAVDVQQPAKTIGEKFMVFDL